MVFATYTLDRTEGITDLFDIHIIHPIDTIQDVLMQELAKSIEMITGIEGTKSIEMTEEFL
ncbi:hypothetical protein MACH07_28090 [Flagellimonas marinaquae]|uniref:Uncharacterized protein n=1 Tax=Flagellimonas marinaquae TaxID=254955 RepID=A0AA48KM92_9FLAO|nr:hypothetical protein MACH07_28090 [Allomuricauda aquimarina]